MEIIIFSSCVKVLVMVNDNCGYENHIQISTESMHMITPKIFLMKYNILVGLNCRTNSGDRQKFSGLVSPWIKPIIEIGEVFRVTEWVFWDKVMNPEGYVG